MIPIAKPYLTEEDANAPHDVILSGWVTQGPKVQEFEENFAEYVGAKHAVAVSSCTTALHLAMLVAGVGEGDEVICPSMSYIATANSIRYANAIPVFAEVGDDYNLDIDDAQKKITSKTKAILLVHQIGMPADIDAFRQLCEAHNVILIEDAACAVGSAYNGQKIGSHSELVCFSFHPRKVITTGDGGMITTSNPKFAERLKRLRQHGVSVTDRARHSADKIIFEEYLELGYNYRMTDIQASVGIKQLEKLDKIIEKRRTIALRYHQELGDLDFLCLPVAKEGSFSNYQSYSIYLKENCPVSRDELMQKLFDAGVSSRRGIMTAHRELAYRDLCKDVSLPVSEDLADNSILIPLFAQMTEEEQNYVIKSIRSAFK
ncbi:MAG: aminotransferase DegT [Flavobacteriales bacterium]|nr:MAG: aminotransferase DegT [Flavobacteriales bacterium]